MRRLFLSLMPVRLPAVVVSLFPDDGIMTDQTQLLSFVSYVQFMLPSCWLKPCYLP